MESLSQILQCVHNNDIEGLKSFINHPDLFQIKDASGKPILHIAISENKIAVFDFLLSLDDCPIDISKYNNQTALEFAICSGSKPYRNEHFAYSLLKKGAHIDFSYRFNQDSLLHQAIRRGYSKVTQFLIEKGADLHCPSIFDQTPLSLLFRFNDVNETLAMLLYSGVDPLIPGLYGFRVIDFVFKGAGLSASMLEHLAYYLFDDYSTDFEILISNFFDLLQLESPLIPQILKNITSVDLSHMDYFPRYFIKLFKIKPERLKLLLEKFDYVVEEITDATPNFNESCEFSSEIFMENFDLMLQSEFSSAFIKIMKDTEISKLIRQLQHCKMPQNELFGIIMNLLSYGADIYDEDLEKIYETLGDCEFFRMLLYMDIKVRNGNQKRDIMPGLLYDINMDIETFLNDPQNFKCSQNAVKHLSNYFAHPKLKNFCYSLPIQDGDFLAKIKDLPSVPFLVELARNKVRKLLIKKYKIENSMQFYTLIKHLPIKEIHKKIITLETKLYQNY